MDENKEEGIKKESIDEILSDLNALLNKMPVILEGVKLPETKPAEMEEPSTAPVPAPEPKKEDAFEKTFKVAPDEMTASSSGGSVDKMVLQSLDACMLSPESLETPDANSRMSEPLALPAEQGSGTPVPGSLEINPFSEEIMPDSEQQPSPADEEKKPSSAETPEEVPLQGVQPLEGGGDSASDAGEGKGGPEAASFESTRDFGIPDIDALMNLSQGSSSANDLGGGVSDAAPGSVPLSEVTPLSSPEEAPVSKAAAGSENLIIAPVGDPALAEGEGMDLKNGSSGSQDDAGKTTDGSAGDAPDGGQPAGPLEEITLAIPPQQAEEPKTGADASAENIVLEPLMPAVQAEDDQTAQVPPPAEQSAASEGLVLEPTQPPGDFSQVGNEQIVASEGLVLEPTQPLDGLAPAENDKTAETPASGDQPEATGKFTLEQPLSVSGDPAPVVSDPAAPNELSLKPVETESAPSDEEKTMVLAPQDGDQTVIFEGANAVAASDTAVSSEPKDFGMLSSRTVPDNVKPEQVRNVAFIYSSDDEAFCAEVLAELDAICLKSSENPMFINRALVDLCGAGINGNVVLQKVTDAKALGLICLGNVPQETAYEMENVFIAAGVLYRHYTRETFNHSTALDLVMEFILK